MKQKSSSQPSQAAPSESVLALFFRMSAKIMAQKWPQYYIFSYLCNHQINDYGTHDYRKTERARAIVLTPFYLFAEKIA
jgi:hypothetical protein